MPEASDKAAAKSGLQSLSDVVHQRSRLAVLATLYEVRQAEFSFLSKVTGLTAGNLSRHLQVLEDGGLIDVHKGFVGRRPCTVLELTREGVAAFEHEVSVLRDLVEAAAPTRRQPVRRPSNAAPRLRPADTT